jgi:hypothetical protein
MVKFIKEESMLGIYIPTYQVDRIRRVNKKFGIDYVWMFIHQRGKCGICGLSQSLCSRALSVDHNHLTGEVRGLVCPSCNASLPYHGDSWEELKNYRKTAFKPKM